MERIHLVIENYIVGRLLSLYSCTVCNRTLQLYIIQYSWQRCSTPEVQLYVRSCLGRIGVEITIEQEFLEQATLPSIQYIYYGFTFILSPLSSFILSIFNVIPPCLIVLLLLFWLYMTWFLLNSIYFFLTWLFLGVF